MSDDEDNGSQASVKRIPKKKHYPFGTPSHSRHAYSAIAHLPVDTQSFALDLATATDIEPEIIEVEPKKVPRRARRGSVGSPGKSKKKKKKKNGGEDDDDEEEHDGDDDENDNMYEIPDAEGMDPCTKIACQVLVRQLLDIQYKNEDERYELEDEYDRLLVEHTLLEEEVGKAEEKLDRMGVQEKVFEANLTQLVGKVETLEKVRENLLHERSETNNRLMMLEVEKQKYLRNLDLAQKALADAMWRKKKREQQANVESGLSLEPSIIGESTITQASPKSLRTANSVASTDYNRLARKQVIDYLEQPATVITVPPYLTDKLSNEPNAFDKYSAKHFDRLLNAANKTITNSVAVGVKTAALTALLAGNVLTDEDLDKEGSAFYKKGHHSPDKRGLSGSGGGIARSPGSLLSSSSPPPAAGKSTSSAHSVAFGVCLSSSTGRLTHSKSEIMKARAMLGSSGAVAAMSGQALAPSASSVNDGSSTTYQQQGQYGSPAADIHSLRREMRGAASVGGGRSSIVSRSPGSAAGARLSPIGQNSMRGSASTGALPPAAAGWGRNNNNNTIVSNNIGNNNSSFRSLESYRSLSDSLDKFTASRRGYGGASGSGGGIDSEDLRSSLSASAAYFSHFSNPAAAAGANDSVGSPLTRSIDRSGPPSMKKASSRGYGTGIRVGGGGGGSGSVGVGGFSKGNAQRRARIGEAVTVGSTIGDETFDLDEGMGDLGLGGETAGSPDMRVLDSVFFKNSTRVEWGRDRPVGKVRKARLDKRKPRSSNEEDGNIDFDDDATLVSNSVNGGDGASVGGLSRATSHASLDGSVGMESAAAGFSAGKSSGGFAGSVNNGRNIRTPGSGPSTGRATRQRNYRDDYLKKIPKSKILTVRHPGLQAFGSNSMTLSPSK